MAGNDINLKNARLTLREIPIKRVLVRKVSANNGTSGKLTLPKELIGQEVYVVLPK